MYATSNFLCKYAIFDTLAMLNVCKCTAAGKDVTKSYYCNISLFAFEIYCFTDGACLFKQPWNIIYY